MKALPKIKIKWVSAITNVYMTYLRENYFSFLFWLLENFLVVYSQSGKSKVGSINSIPFTTRISRPQFFFFPFCHKYVSTTVSCFSLQMPYRENGSRHRSRTSEIGYLAGEIFWFFFKYQLISAGVFCVIRLKIIAI